jgi:RNA 2',3'-cyclic 3'-phosphodiesterase
MKLFVAIEVPDTLRARLTALPDLVGADGWRLTSPALMHITVRFLGNVPGDRVEALTRALDVVAQRRAPFTVRLEGVGMFGSAKQPRVLWAGVRDDEKASLAALANDVDASIDPIVAALVGPRDRPFAAHVTLGRAKPKLRDRPAAKVAHPERARANEEGAMPLSMAVEELVLFDSAPSPLAYTAVWRGRLGTG